MRVRDFRLPSAAASLGYVYIEGLGTKQDIPRAERYYKFAEKSGYTDPEYWVWVHYGVTLRQVVPPAKILEEIRQHGNDYKDARTCLYFVREKVYLYENYLNVPVRYAANILMKSKPYFEVWTIYMNGDRVDTSYKTFYFKQ